MEVGGSFWFGVAPRDGDPGESAVMYNIEASSDVITADANGIVKRTIMYTLKKIVGSDSSPDANYFPWIRWYNGSVEIASKTPGSKSESIALTESYPLATHVVVGFSGTYLGAYVTIKQFNIVRDNPIPFPRAEEWNVDLVFKNGEYLMHEDIVYMWSSPGKGNSPVNPKDDIINNPDITAWKAYQNWPLLSTEILLARFALLAGAVAHDNKLFSQTGKTDNGEETNDYANKEGKGFNPYLVLDWLKGVLKGQKIEMISGLIGDLILENGYLHSENFDPVREKGTAYSKDGYAIYLDDKNGLLRPSSGGGLAGLIRAVIYSLAGVTGLRVSAENIDPNGTLKDVVALELEAINDVENLLKRPLALRAKKGDVEVTEGNVRIPAGDISLGRGTIKGGYLVYENANSLSGYRIGNDDEYILCTNSDKINLTLPPSPRQGKTVLIKQTGSGEVGLIPSSGHKIYRRGNTLNWGLIKSKNGGVTILAVATYIGYINGADCWVINSMDEPGLDFGNN